MRHLIPQVIYQDIYHIPEKYWEEKKIKAAVFDIDNTLACYLDPEPGEKAQAFLKDLRARGVALCVLSNNKPERVERFCKKLGIPFIPDSGKPLRKAYLAALEKVSVSPEDAVMIGDQIFTDIWGANRLGMHTILVEPFDDRENPFIKFKRMLEKPFLRAYHGRRRKQ